MKKLRKRIPDKSFIAHYMDIMAAQETSELYDFWCAVWLIGSLVGRNSVVARPLAPVYLNWYMVLVAESGITRKSSAVRQVTELVQLLNTTHNITTRVTPEALEWQMHELQGKPVSICISELATFLSKQSHAIALPALLTDLYDCPKRRVSPGTKSGGGIVLEDVWCSFLSASTPSWLATGVHESVVEGGFTSRCLFIHDEKPKKRIPWPKPAAEETHQALLDTAKSITEHAPAVPEITISKGGLRRFSQWYRYRKLHHDPFRASFEAREDAHILRLAACLAINAERWEIESCDITFAIDCIEQARESAARIFDGSGSRSQFVTAIDRTRRRLLENGMDGVLHSQLQQQVKNLVPASDFRMMMNTMHEMHLVEKYAKPRQHGQRGPESVMYIPTHKLAQRGVMRELLLETGAS